MLCGKFACAMMAAAGIVASANADLVSHLAVDNFFDLYISSDDSTQGTLIGSGNNWQVTSNFNTVLATLPLGGTYYIHARARGDGSTIEAFIGDFAVDSRFRFDNGLTSITTNTTNWRESSTGWGNWNLSPVSAGQNGVSPWGFRNGISANATWLRYDLGTTRYFSTTITSVVPLPPAAMSGVACLATIGGLALVRRRRLARA